MRIPLPRLLAAWLLACTFVAQAADTPSSSSLEAERAAAYKAAQATQKPGPAEIALRDQAHLHLPAGYLWVPQPAAGQLMQAMGNRVDDSFVGAIFPAGDADWFAVVKFVKEGYIKDDDAKDWNADDLLKSLREGTEAANAERVRRGITPRRRCRVRAARAVPNSGRRGPARCGRRPRGSGRRPPRRAAGA